MLRYVEGRELARYPRLATTMFRDRAAQFHARLGWEVHVTKAGEERDQYDRPDALYLIWENARGEHGGSMRFLPTTTPVMVNEHFSHLIDGRRIAAPEIWECTRFCLAPEAGPRVAAALMLGGSELGLGLGLSHVVGVFDARMVRVYRRLGWGPTILGADGPGPRATSVGLWQFSPAQHARLAASAGISAELSRLWFTRAFGRGPALRAG